MTVLGRLRGGDRVNLFAVALLTSAIVGAHAAIGKASFQGPANRRAVRVTTPRLVFGIYPGGGAGTVGTAGATKPEDPAKRLAALRNLRVPGRPFVLHIYATYSGLTSASAAAQVAGDVAGYTQSGFEVELVLTYRPAHANRNRDVAAFAQFVRDAVRSFGTNPGFVSVQVTNEANIRNAPNAADGYYAGAEDALVQGVIAAKAEARADHYRQVKVGFNWAYSDDRLENAFWHGLARRGGTAFRRSLDWVGLDVYPGTWGPTLASRDLIAATRRTMLAALTGLRKRYMPLAGLRATTALHISENGYPTGPGRSDKLQVAVMRAAIKTVNTRRAAYHVTDYRWFDLRDANSASSSFEEHYGLMRDDYSPKPAYGVYRQLVISLGAG